MIDREITRLFELYELLFDQGEVDVELEMEYAELARRFEEKNE